MAGSATMNNLGDDERDAVKMSESVGKALTVATGIAGAFVVARGAGVDAGDTQDDVGQREGEQELGDQHLARAATGTADFAVSQRMLTTPAATRPREHLRDDVREVLVRRHLPAHERRGADGRVVVRTRHMAAREDRDHQQETPSFMFLRRRARQPGPWDGLSGPTEQLLAP
jgi:hypothetical protein